MNVFIDGQKLNDLLYITDVQGVHDMPPAVGLTNRLVTGSKAYLNHTRFEERVITLTCAAIRDQQEGKLLAHKMDQIKRLLSPLKEKELVFGAYPDRYIKGRIEGGMDLQQIGQMGFFNITFYCADPFYYDKVQRTSSTAVTSFNAENFGSWNSDKLLIELTPTTQTTITNTSTQETLVLNPKNKKIILDFEKACIIGGVAENANDAFKSGSFFKLQPGNNALTSNTPMLVRYRSCYL